MLAKCWGWSSNSPDNTVKGGVRQHPPLLVRLLLRDHKDVHFCENKSGHHRFPQGHLLILWYSNHSISKHPLNSQFGRFPVLTLGILIGQWFCCGSGNSPTSLSLTSWNPAFLAKLAVSLYDPHWIYSSLSFIKSTVPARSFEDIDIKGWKGVNIILSSASQMGTVVAPTGHLSLSGDVSGCHQRRSMSHPLWTLTGQVQKNIKCWLNSHSTSI